MSDWTRIKKLTELIVGLQGRIKEITKLSQKNRQEVQQKEKELEEWRKELEVCQQEKKAIEKEIKDKVAELENSQLSNTEKQEKINKLLTEHSEELEAVDKLLEEERTQYRSLRDQIIDKLCGPCSACAEKEQDKKHLRQKNVYFSGLVALLVVLLFVFHVWFIRWAWEKKCRVKFCNHPKK